MEKELNELQNRIDSLQREVQSLHNQLEELKIHLAVIDAYSIRNISKQEPNGD